MAALAFTGCEKSKMSFIETVKSQNDQTTTLTKLVKLIKDENLTYYETFDHLANAKKINKFFTPESVVMFGNPHFATTLMQCNPSMGVDLPLRIVVTTNYEGETSLIYTNPEYWSLKHNIKDKKCLTILGKARMALEDLTSKAAKK